MQNMVVISFLDWVVSLGVFNRLLKYINNLYK